LLSLFIFGTFQIPKPKLVINFNYISMIKVYRTLLLLAAICLTGFSYAQTAISGKIIDAAGEPLAGANIIVKGTVTGTIASLEGTFNLKVNSAPPVTLVVSFIGYATQEISITDANTSGLSIKLEEQTVLGQEVVVSASRVEESILESPVSIEKVDSRALQNTPADNYYKGLANLKGVDVATSSINFQIINTRGFGSTGNTRFVQLTDGMDTQAPALNFPIGNLNGPSELDVESLELIPGASSALYGPNAFNGVLLVTSKNPFEYQGLSAFAKAGLNHVGNNADYSGPSPVWEGAIRYAKAFNNKFAFKVNVAGMRAQDWHGTSAYDRSPERKGDFSVNQGADKLNYMGDEAAINLAIFDYSDKYKAIAGSGGPTKPYNNVYGPGLTARSYADAGDLPNQVVSVTPYAEKDVVNYNAKNLKANAGAYYRITDKMELSLLYNGGFGTSVYTGAQRYSLVNFGINQYRLQLRGDNFYVRAYTTRENSGDSYIAEFLAKRINDYAAESANTLYAANTTGVQGYLITYANEYLRYLHNAGLAPGEINSLSDADLTAKTGMNKHQIMDAAFSYARNHVDNGSLNDGGVLKPMHLDPNSAEFKEIKKKAMNGTVPSGPRFNDRSKMYHGEAQYDFKNQVHFMELQVGGNYRVYDLHSKGTIFDDKDKDIFIKEFGAYMQAGKWLGDHKVKLSGSVRYDKNMNFKGRVNPRIAIVYKASENNNFRASFQTGFRIPSTQGQYIDLNVLGSQLLGGLQQFATKYNLVDQLQSSGKYLSFEGNSVLAFRNAVFANGDVPAATQKLVEFKHFNPVKPESIQAIEVGYKSVIQNNLLLDFSYYYNIYHSFITQIQVVKALEDTNNPGNPNYLTILNSTNENTFSIYTNAPGRVTAQGAVAAATYSLPKGYTIGGNYNFNILQNVPAGFIPEYNTPKNKLNITFGNRKVTNKIGYSLTWRWQSAFKWQSSFTNYTYFPVPSYNTLDAQITYKVPTIKSSIKVGGSNILNNKYVQSGGGPNISGLYYVSITFDQLMK
jgi:iron complex outermembrane receptor protein